MPVTRAPARAACSREAAPAAADLQHVTQGRGVPARRTARGGISLLRVFERRARNLPVEQRRRIRHRRVEPQRVERVAEIVVRDDVLRRAGARIRTQEVLEAQQRANRRAAIKRALQRRLVGSEHGEQPHEIGRVAATVHVRFGEADVAAATTSVAIRPVVERAQAARPAAPSARPKTRGTPRRAW